MGLPLVDEAVAELAADPLEMLFEAMRLLDCLPNATTSFYYIKNIWWPEVDRLKEAFALYKTKD